MKIRGTVTKLTVKPPTADRGGYAVLTIEKLPLFVYDPQLASTLPDLLYRDVEALVEVRHSSKNGDYNPRLYARAVRAV